MTDTPPPVVSIEDVLADPGFTDANPRRGDFEARFAFIGRALATEGLGINLTVVPPRSKAFPRHYHYVNHELFVILDGSGVLHHGEEDHALKPLDVVFIRAGTGIPFQIENTGDAEMRYLALSTLIPADVFHYPDGDKYGVMAAGTPFRDLASGDLARFSHWFRRDSAVGYWDGEVEEG